MFEFVHKIDSKNVKKIASIVSVLFRPKQQIQDLFPVPNLNLSMQDMYKNVHDWINCYDHNDSFDI